MSEEGIITMYITPKSIFDMYIKRFERIDRYPNRFTKSLLKTRKIMDQNWSFDIVRFFEINNIKEKELSINSELLPTIDILILITAKDLEIANATIKYAKLSSFNPIGSIYLIVPARDFEMINKEVVLFQNDIKIKLISEDDVIGHSTRSLIESKRPDRFGWILQQVIVTKFISASKTSGVLVIDADTVLLKSKIWLRSNKQQVLMPTLEFHPSYYRFLENYKEIYKLCTHSFVSHHMVFQPEILRELTSHWNHDIDIVLNEAFDYSNENDMSPFCLKYEFYAQFLISNYPELVAYEKWGNVQFNRRKGKLILSDLYKTKRLAKRYNSLSIHHWDS